MKTMDNIKARIKAWLKKQEHDPVNEDHAVNINTEEKELMADALETIMELEDQINEGY